MAIVSIFRPGLFSGKTALITGGGSGIGLRTARELAQLGAAVIIAGRNEERLDGAEASLLAEGATALALPLNVRDPASVEACVKASLQWRGRLDFLVNNAGGQFPSEAADISPKGWLAVIETNLTGPFLMARETFRTAFREHGGTVVNVLANFRNGFPTMAHTGAARAGVDNLTKSLAQEWAHFGVRINSVAPGIIDSSGLNSYTPETQAKIRDYERFNYAHRLGTEGEVAASILFLLSPAASYLTGFTLFVDGGESIYSPLFPPRKHRKLGPGV